MPEKQHFFYVLFVQPNWEFAKGNSKSSNDQKGAEKGWPKAYETYKGRGSLQ